MHQSATYTYNNTTVAGASFFEQSPRQSVQVTTLNVVEPFQQAYMTKTVPKVWRLTFDILLDNTSKRITHAPYHHMKYNLSLLCEQLPVEKHLILDSSSHQNLFKDYDIHNVPIFKVKEDTVVYVMEIGTLRCFIEGTDITKTQKVRKECECRDGWYGPWCSFPELLVMHSDQVDFTKLVLRKSTRRIFHATPFNIEFEMLETRFAELKSVVDVFMISESNYTAYGDPKPLRLLHMLKKGFAKDVHDKILYLFLPYFPQNAYSNGWIADNLPRDYLGLQGLKNQMSHYRGDDLIMLFDSDELPTREAMMFFKLHDGFPEPFGFHFWETSFGFFWRHTNGVKSLMSGASIGLVKTLFGFHLSWLREATQLHFNKQFDKTEEYKQKSGKEISMWYMGAVREEEGISNFAGWHCTYCFTVEGIRVKMMSLINEDFPRWGDDWKKLEVEDVRRRIRNGVWFDEKPEKLIPPNDRFAPQHLVRHRKRFNYLFEMS